MHDYLRFNGFPSKQEDSLFAVTYWAIPGGCDFNNAYVEIAYFSDESDAKAFCKRYSDMPEMACLISLEEIKLLQLMETAQHAWNSHHKSLEKEINMKTAEQGVRQPAMAKSKMHDQILFPGDVITHLRYPNAPEDQTIPNGCIGIVHQADKEISIIRDDCKAARKAMRNNS